MCKSNAKMNGFYISNLTLHQLKIIFINKNKRHWSSYLKQVVYSYDKILEF